MYSGGKKFKDILSILGLQVQFISVQSVTLTHMLLIHPPQKWIFKQDNAHCNEPKVQ